MNEHRSLTSRAYHRIREMVLSGEIQPGSRIQIDHLRRELEMGASPVREALSTLSSEQLVVRSEQRGFWAPDVSAEDFKILLDTRCRVEAIAIRDAVAYGAPSWEEQIVMLQYRLNALDRTDKADEWERAHRAFHHALIAACPSHYLVDFCMQLYDLAVRYRNIARPAAYPERKISEEHQGIAEATLARDADRAAKLLVEHYQKTGEFLFNSLARQNETTPATV